MRGKNAQDIFRAVCRTAWARQWHHPTPFLIIFLVVALIGVLVQYFATGSDAAANREATRKRLNKGGEEWQQYSDMKKEPLTGP